jgi:hypothetical protein
LSAEKNTAIKSVCVGSLSLQELSERVEWRDKDIFWGGAMTMGHLLERSFLKLRIYMKEQILFGMAPNAKPNEETGTRKKNWYSKSFTRRIVHLRSENAHFF